MGSHANIFEGLEADQALVGQLADIMSGFRHVAVPAKQAAFFSLFGDLDTIRDTCLARGSILGLRRWVMILLMFALFLRLVVEHQVLETHAALTSRPKAVSM